MTDKKKPPVHCQFEAMDTALFERQHSKELAAALKSALMQVSSSGLLPTPERLAQAFSTHWTHTHPTVALPQSWKPYILGQLALQDPPAAHAQGFKSSASEDFELFPATDNDHLHLLEPKAHILLLQEQLAQCQEKLDMVRLRLELDPLTNVLNRKGLHRAFKKEASKSARKKAHVHMLFIEPFEKQQLTNIHSMQFLEALLVHISARLMHLVRPEDHVGYLHEEGVFALVLCDTPARQVQVVVKRLLHELPQGHCAFRYHQIPVNISLSGVSAHQDDDFEHLCAKGVGLLKECAKLGMNKAHLDIQDKA